MPRELAISMSLPQAESNKDQAWEGIPRESSLTARHEASVFSAIPSPCLPCLLDV